MIRNDLPPRKAPAEAWPLVPTGTAEATCDVMSSKEHRVPSRVARCFGITCCTLPRNRRDRKKRADLKAPLLWPLDLQGTGRDAQSLSSWLRTTSNHYVCSWQPSKVSRDARKAEKACCATGRPFQGKTCERGAVMHELRNCQQLMKPPILESPSERIFHFLPRNKCSRRMSATSRSTCL